VGLVAVEVEAVPDLLELIMLLRWPRRLAELHPSRPLLLDVSASLYETKAGEAIFWSGCTDGIGATDAAEAIAHAQGGTTLEKLVRVRGIPLPPWDASSPVSVNAWATASRAYAECASGRTKAVLGATMRPGNIWETVEFPTLKANPNVTEIVGVDPVTGLEQLLYQKSEG
jgi:hypothetical protein